MWLQITLIHLLCAYQIRLAPGQIPWKLSKSALASPAEGLYLHFTPRG